MAVAALVTLAVSAGLAAAPEGAHAGSYLARFCSAPVPQQLGTEGLREGGNAGNYQFWNRCPDGSSLLLRPTGPTQHGKFRHVYWDTPPGVRITHVTADVSLRREDGHQSELYVAHRSGGAKAVLAQGSPGPSDWRTVSVSTGTGRHRVGLSIFCVRNPSCPGSSLAQARARNIRISLLDEVKPTLAASGSALSGGWKRSVVGLSVAGSDQGSGIHRLSARVNGQLVGPWGNYACKTLADGSVSAMQPCAPARSQAASLDTRSAPWRDGANELIACGYDYPVGGGNHRCSGFTINVDNTPPRVSFQSAQDPADPELIRVSVRDEHSGVRSDNAKIRHRRVGGSAWSELEVERVGDELHARIDSERPEPGEYELEANVSDHAGNTTTTSKRADGKPMRLTFPLRGDVRLTYRLNGGGGQRAARITYNGRRGLSGRLVGAEGDPIAGATVQVVERFVGRARPKQRATERVTDARGAFSTPLARGPSRGVRVTYAGSRRYRPASPARRLGLRVRSHARLTRATPRVRAGNRATFRGRIGVRGAVVPSDGKLYELQVKQGPRRWTTVSQARHTRSNGRLRFTYRFGRFYTRPTRFRFRIKVTREPGWPYLTPVRSNVRRVTVVPR